MIRRPRGKKGNPVAAAKLTGTCGSRRGSSGRDEHCHFPFASSASEDVRREVFLHQRFNKTGERHDNYQLGAARRLPFTFLLKRLFRLIIN